jgi:hypothetical protein
MRAPHVCTEPATHRRIVSLNPKALGASSSSRRIRREENHFIFAVGTNYHLYARNLPDGRMFTLHLQLLDLTLFNLFYPFSRTILERSESPAHSSYKPIVEPRRRYPVVKAVIVPKSEWAVVTLINLIYSLTAGSSFYSVLILVAVCKDPSVLVTVHRAPDFLRFFEIFDFRFQNFSRVGAAMRRRTSISSPGGEEKDEGGLSPRQSLIQIHNVLELSPQSSVLSPKAYKTLDYRRLSGIIGFEISLSSNRAKPFSSPRGRGYSAGAARTEGELCLCSAEPGIFNEKSVSPDHQAMYRIYKFTQIHTITFQLYITAKPLHPNKLQFTSTQKDKIPPHPVLYKIPSLKKNFQLCPVFEVRRNVRRYIKRRGNRAGTQMESYREKIHLVRTGNITAAPV